MLVELKRYKVAYWQDGSVLNSQMFDTLSQAESFTQKLSTSTLYTIMESKEIGDGSYSWTVLKNGVGKFLPTMSALYRQKTAIGIGIASMALILRDQSRGSGFKLTSHQGKEIHPAVELAKYLDKVFQSRSDSMSRAEKSSLGGMIGLNHPFNRGRDRLNFAVDVRMEYMHDPSILSKLINPFDWSMPKLEYGRYFFKHVPSGIVFVVGSKARPTSSTVFEPIVYARMNQKQDYAEPSQLYEVDGYKVFAFKNPITLFAELNKERQHDVWFRTKSKYDEEIIGIENLTTDKFPPKGDIKIISYNDWK